MAEKTHWFELPAELRAGWRKAARAGELATFQASHPEIDWSPIGPSLPPALRWWRGPTPRHEWFDDPDALDAAMADDAALKH